MRSALRLTVLLLSVSTATTALASSRMSESTYLRAARCQGLAHVSALGVSNPAALDAAMTAQGENRDARLRNAARQARAEAQREGANPATHARLKNELTKRCSAFIGADVATASTGGTSSAR